MVFSRPLMTVRVKNGFSHSLRSLGGGVTLPPEAKVVGIIRHKRQAPPAAMVARAALWRVVVVGAEERGREEALRMLAASSGELRDVGHARLVLVARDVATRVVFYVCCLIDDGWTK